MADSLLKCIIVDDSPLQRLSIGKLVKENPSLELVNEFSNAPKAREFLRTQEVDLIFLDVEMPLLSGFDLLDKLEERPEIIFITGKTEYAFMAFNYEAVDFLQKPVDKLRFDRAVEKAVSISKLKSKNGADGNGSFIFIKSKLKKYKVFVDDIRYIEAKGDYAMVVSKDENFTVLTTMKAFEKELPEKQFLRVHKSFIVNLVKVESYDSKFVQLENENIPLSRHKKESLQQALDEISPTKVNMSPH